MMINIYDMRTGICKHYTELCNALLYSLGYKAIDATGFAITENTFDNKALHSWSLIKLGDKWHPFDTIGGIFYGKLQISLLLFSKENFTYEYFGFDLKNNKYKAEGKY